MADTLGLELAPRTGGGVADFVDTYGQAAAEAGAKLGVDPRAILAQWGLETGWGRSVIPGTNNLGNIKATGWGGPSAPARDNMLGTVDKYRAYDTPEAFAEDYANLIGSNPRYRGAVGAGGDISRFVQGMVQGGYAEDPKYGQKLAQAFDMVSGAELPEARGQQTAPSEEEFDIDASPLSPKAKGGAPKRSTLAAVNDTVINTANAAVGLVKTIPDLVSPGNFISNALEEFIKSGQEKQSEWQKVQNRRLQNQLERADGEVDKVAIWAKHVATVDPLSLVADFAGNFGPFKALGLALKGAGVGEAAARHVLEGVGAGMAAGEVRGNIYDKIQELKDSDLQANSPVYQEMRQTMSEADAKKALGQRLPRTAEEWASIGLAAGMGAITGRFGLEGSAAGVTGIAGRGARTVVAVGSEGLQGGAEQFATNVGVQKVRPEQGLFEDVLLNSAREGIIAGPGAVLTPARRAGAIEEDKTRKVLADIANAGTVDDAIQAASNAVSGAEAPFYDTLEGRVKFADAAIDRDILRGMREDERFGPQSTNELMQALAIARNPRLDEVTRTQAIDGVERLLTAWNERPDFVMGQNTPEAPAGPGTAVAPVRHSGGLPAETGERPTGRTVEGEVSTYGGELPNRANRVEDQRPLQEAAAEDAAGAAQRAAERSDATKAQALAEPSDRVAMAEAEAAARTAAESARTATTADVDARVEGARRHEAAARRDQILSRVMSEEGVADPVRRFEAELRREGIAANKATSLEVERLKRAADARATLSQDERIPSAPNEMPEDIVPARGARVDRAAHEAATSKKNDLPQPTEPMTRAGNYKKGKFSLAGFNISVENPNESERTGVDPNGKRWRVKMRGVHYGYITGVPRGKDGDHIDIFVKAGTPLSWRGKFFVIDQNTEGGRFDEHKIVAGAQNAEEALRLYRAQYEKGAARHGGVVGMTPEQLQDWFDNGDTTQRVTKWAGGERTTPRAPQRAATDRAVPPAAAQPESEQSATVADSRRSENPTVAQVRAWIGPRKNVEVVATAADLPDDVRDALKLQRGDVLEGAYVKGTGRVYIVAEAIPSRARALWVAAHEGGHRGFDALNRATGGEAMRRAQGLRANATVQALSEAVAADRGIAVGRLSMEEALMELIAADTTGDFSGLADRYGVNATALRTPRTMLGRFMDWLRGWFKSNGATDAEVRTFLREISNESAVDNFHGADGSVAAMIAYHGSGRRGISKFDTAKIGEGSGDNDYGWGLYFTSKPEIAEWHRRQLSEEVTKLGLVPIEELYETAVEKFGKVPGEALRYAVDNGLVDARDTFDAMRDPKERDSGWMDDASDAEIDSAIALLKKMKVEYAGGLYTADIPETTNMLRWDRGFNDQPDVVKAAWSGFGLPESGTGGAAYRGMAQKLGSARDASMELLARGVLGIQYADALQPKESNYVVFSAEDTKILSDRYAGGADGDVVAVASTVSARRPTAKKATEDPLAESLQIDLDAMRRSGEAAFAKNIDIMSEYPGMGGIAGTPDERAEQIVQRITDNLLWLHDQVPAATRANSKQWYDGARKLADAWAAKYGVTRDQSAAVIAAMSPQKDWYMNVTAAERVLDVWHDQQQHRWDPAMDMIAGKILPKSLRGQVAGKRLSQLKTLVQKAAWIRVYDQAHNPRSYRMSAPTGAFIGWMKTGKGSNSKLAWGSFSEIGKAISALTDGSRENISALLGDQHKVRSFFNNITEPNDEGGSVTIDTHAVAAGLLRGMSGSSAEVTHNFGSGGVASSSITGAQGTYGIYAEAYRRAAAVRGIFPREMQSITWEAVRGLFKPTFKAKKSNVQAIDNIWRRVDAGEVTTDEARNEIVQRAGRIDPPSWEGSDSGRTGKAPSSSYRSELAGNVGFAGAAGRGVKSGNAGGPSDQGSAATGRGRFVLNVAVPVSDTQKALAAVRMFLSDPVGAVTRSEDGASFPMSRKSTPKERSKIAEMLGGVDVSERAAGDEAVASVAPKLTNRQIEDRLQAKIDSDYEAAVAEYNALPDAMGGRVLNTDLARELSPEYREDRTLSAAVHEPASAFVKRRYADMLAAPTPANRDPVVLFTAGGTGAGKSTGLRILAGAADRAEIIYDTNMNALPSSVSKIEAALKSGRDVTILYTYRDPVEALVHGALPRAMRMGRTVPMNEHAKTHVGARKVVDQLADRYRGNDRVTIVVVDNGRGKGKAAVVARSSVPAVDENVGQSLREALESEYAQGRISEAVYRGTSASSNRQEPQGVVPEGGERVRGQPQPERQRPEVMASVSRTPDWAKGNAALESATGKIDTYAPKKTLREKVSGMMDNWKTRLVQGVFDQFRPLEKLSHKAYVLARMSKSADGVLEGLLLHGKPVMHADGHIYGDLDGKGFLGAMQALNGEHDRFLAWVAGNRSAKLMIEGREHLFTPAEIAALQGANRGNMPDGSSRAQAYARALQTLQDYNKSVLDIAEKTGLIDPVGRAVWESEFYVPFYREMEGNEISGPGMVKGLVRQRAFQKLKGGEENLGDLMENTLRNWSHLISASMANQAAAASLTEAERQGVAITADADTARQIAKRTSGKGSATYFMDQGKEHWMVVGDPFVLDAITALEAGPLRGWAMDWMSKAKRTLTIGTTISPSFKIRNLIRDSLAAIGQNDMSYNVAKNLVEGWQGTRKDSTEYAQMLFGGAMMRFGQFNDDHAEHAKRLIEQGVDANTILSTPEKIKAAFGKVWDSYQDFGDRMENINRAALYKQLIARGVPPLEAAYQARDFLDFQLQGSFVAMRFLSQVVPFLNARAQGLYKLGRAGKEDPTRLFAVSAAVALASIGLLLAYADDDDWKAREDWDRDAYWWFKIGDTAFRIPKPFEIGALGTIAERSWEFVISDEMTGKRLGERMASMVKDTFAMNPVPQLFKPALDLYANKDSFTGRQIETKGMERFSKSERKSYNTSWIAETLGAAGDTTGISPVQVDHLIRAYFGWLGSHIAMGVDTMAADPLRGRTHATRRWDETFVIGDFVKEVPSNRSRYVEDFYKQAKAVHEVMADIKQARELGELEKATRLAAENEDKIVLNKAYTQAEKKIGEINKALRLAQYRAMDPSEKREVIDRLSQQRAQIARTVELQRAAMRQ